MLGHFSVTNPDNQSKNPIKHCKTDLIPGLEATILILGYAALWLGMPDILL